MEVAFLGDIHGKWHLLPQATHCPVIQVGDLGLGFGGHEDPPHLASVSHFIRGNHDNPQVCAKRSEYLGDYGVNPQLNNLFFVGGGYSIDRCHRKEGVDWWTDEELTIAEFNNMLALYEKIKPAVVVTHEAPALIVEKTGLLDHIWHYQASRTAQALDAMMEIHRPKLWVFGHHHRHVGREYGHTRFVGLDEGELYHTNI